MKKLLLALLILVAGVMPNMAQNCINDPKCYSESSVNDTTDYLNTETEIYHYNKVDDAVNSCLSDYIKNRNFNSATMELIPFFLKDTNESMWKLIYDATVENVVNASIENLHSTDFIEFLINQGMPESEYNRYIKQTKEIMSSSDYKTAPYVNSYEEILEQNRKYEIAKQILALFEQAKAIKNQKANDNVSKSFDTILEKASPEIEIHMDLIDLNYK